TASWQRRGAGTAHMEGDEPAPRRVTDDSHRGWVERRNLHTGPGPCEPERADGLCQPKLAAAHAECRPSVGGGLAAMPGLEPGTAGPLGEERRERGVLMPQRLLQ